MQTNPERRAWDDRRLESCLPSDAVRLDVRAVETKRRAAARRFMGVVDAVLGCGTVNGWCHRPLFFV